MPLGPPDKPRPAVFGLLLLGGVGLTLVAIGIFAPVFLDPISAWTQLVVGFLALISSLGGLWVIQRERDQTLR